MNVAVPTLRRLSIPIPVLLIAAAAWIGVFTMAQEMGAMPGTMGLGMGLGLGLVPFTAMWTLMTAAMMLPSIVPFALVYGRTFQDDRAWRLVALVSGYLIVWTLPAFPVYVLAWWAEQAAATNPGVTIMVAVAALTACGIYQLTPLKSQCLTLCRSPLSDAFKYAAYKGRARDLLVGISHGLYCVGCCWALMVLMLSFGLMNVNAMIILTAVCSIEKLWARGPQFGRLVGGAALVMAAAIVLKPELALWLHHHHTMATMR